MNSLGVKEFANFIGLSRSTWRTKALAAAVEGEFGGALPSWVMERIEAKVRRKQAEELSHRKSLRVRRGKRARIAL